MPREPTALPWAAAKRVRACHREAKDAQVRGAGSGAAPDDSEDVEMYWLEPMGPEDGYAVFDRDTREQVGEIHPWFSKRAVNYALMQN